MTDDERGPAPAEPKPPAEWSSYPAAPCFPLDEHLRRIAAEVARAKRRPVHHAPERSHDASAPPQDRR